jgi:hypothetical protein
MKVIGNGKTRVSGSKLNILNTPILTIITLFVNSSNANTKICSTPQYTTESERFLTDIFANFVYISITGT